MTEKYKYAVDPDNPTRAERILDKYNYVIAPACIILWALIMISGNCGWYG